jgi:succinate dehydrogenase / fumarate reductase iron-sulfur subunit
MAAKTINITLKIWRQKNAKVKGALESYKLDNVSTDSSFLEMLDQLNEQLINEQKEPVAFDHDCREGICGSCSLYINGRAHGPDTGITTCQLHMRMFNDGDTIYVEPWRSTAFPIIKDLVVDRSAFDRIQQAGGFVSVNTGSAPDANSIPVPKANAATSAMRFFIVFVDIYFLSLVEFEYFSISARRSFDLLIPSPLAHTCNAK